MAGTEESANGVEGGVERRGLRSLLSAEGRDFLIRNNGDQVKISTLEEKVVALYFSGSWCGPCRRFTPKLVEVYGELSLKGKEFEVVFISSDEDEDSFQAYFSKMPWLAIPFTDSETREKLNKFFKVMGVPNLVVLDGKSGNVITDDGVDAVSDYEWEAYPFTLERIKQLEEAAAAAKREQTLRSVLVTSSRDYLVSNNGNKVPVAELEGKIVCLYFAISSFGSCRQFTPKLVQMYGELKERGENFEVVLVSLDEEEQAFELALSGVPWLAIPFKDKKCEKLVRYFELDSIPTLVVIGSNGKTLHANAAELVEEHGVEAYPFSPEKLEEIAEKEKARMEAQTLESLLVSGERDYVIGKDGIKVPVSDLVGKNILLYFSAHWCPPCRAFLPKLVDAYHKIKEKHSAFELIFISSDKDQSSFDDYFVTMPWLALPFGDDRKKSLSQTFKIHGIPSLVALGPSGRTITKDARDLVMAHGADAYPFTEERLKQIEAEMEEMAKGWPEKLKHSLHKEHELVLTRRRSYVCDVCDEAGQGWSFYCKECDFDTHPKCALEDNKKDGGVDEGTKAEDNEEEHSGKEGYVCDGDVCYKA